MTLLLHPKLHRSDETRIRRIDNSLQYKMISEHISLQRLSVTAVSHLLLLVRSCLSSNRSFTADTSLQCQTIADNANNWRTG